MGINWLVGWMVHSFFYIFIDPSANEWHDTFIDPSANEWHETAWQKGNVKD